MVREDRPFACSTVRREGRGESTRSLFFLRTLLGPSLSHTHWGFFCTRRHWEKKATGRTAAALLVKRVERGLLAGPPPPPGGGGKFAQLSKGGLTKKEERQIPLPSSAKSLPDAKTRTTHDAACLLRGASAFLSAHKSSSFFPLRRPPVFGVTSTSFHLLFLPPLFCKVGRTEGRKKRVARDDLFSPFLPLPR